MDMFRKPTFWCVLRVTRTSFSSLLNTMPSILWCTASTEGTLWTDSLILVSLSQDSTWLSKNTGFQRRTLSSRGRVPTTNTFRLRTDGSEALQDFCRSKGCDGRLARISVSLPVRVRRSVVVFPNPAELNWEDHSSTGIEDVAVGDNGSWGPIMGEYCSATVVGRDRAADKGVASSDKDSCTRGNGNGFLIRSTAESVGDGQNCVYRRASRVL